MKGGVPTPAAARMGLEDTVPRAIARRQRTTLLDPIYLRDPDRHIHGREQGWGRGWESVSDGDIASVWEAGTVLEVDGGEWLLSLIHI